MEEALDQFMQAEAQFIPEEAPTTFRCVWCMTFKYPGDFRQGAVFCKECEESIEKDNARVDELMKIFEGGDDA